MITFQATDAPLRTVAFSPDGRWLAYGGDRCGVWVRDLIAGRERPAPAPVSRESIVATAFTSENVLLAAGERCLYRWDVADGEIDKSGVFGHFTRFRLSPNETTLFCMGGQDSQPIQELEFPSGNGIRVWPAVKAFPLSRAMDLSPEGGVLASSHFCLNQHRPEREPAIVVLRGVDSGAPLHRLSGIPGDVTAVRFHPDGFRLAALAKDTLHVWDLTKWQEIARRRPCPTFMTALAFTPDGGCLVTVGYDGLVRYWDTTTWKVTATYDWKLGPLLDLAITSDGYRAAACCNSGKVVIWDVDC